MSVLQTKWNTKYKNIFLEMAPARNRSSTSKKEFDDEEYRKKRDKNNLVSKHVFW